MARLARGLIVLRDQFNREWPERSKRSDGWIGDAAHAARTSDHNPDAQGVVRAIDVTHDPDGGADMGVVFQRLLHNQDPRIKYVIFNRRFFSAFRDPWQVRPYNGENPHTTHLHISTVATARADDTDEWSLDMLTDAETKMVKDMFAFVVGGDRWIGAERMRAYAQSSDGSFAGAAVDLVRGRVLQRLDALEKLASNPPTVPAPKFTDGEIDRITYLVVEEILERLSNG